MEIPSDKIGGITTQERIELEKERNAQKRESKQAAASILKTSSGAAMMASLAESGGSMGRRLAREIKRAQRTGRVSNWLAGQTLKEETKREIPSSSVDALIRSGVAPAQFNAPKSNISATAIASNQMSVYDLDICVDGEPKILKVFALARPQDPPIIL